MSGHNDIPFRMMHLYDGRELFTVSLRNEQIAVDVAPSGAPIPVLLAATSAAAGLLFQKYCNDVAMKGYEAPEFDPFWAWMGEKAKRSANMMLAGDADEETHDE